MVLLYSNTENLKSSIPQRLHIMRNIKDFIAGLALMISMLAFLINQDSITWSVSRYVDTHVWIQIAMIPPFIALVAWCMWKHVQRQIKRKIKA